jgi:amino acid transporter
VGIDDSETLTISPALFDIVQDMVASLSEEVIRPEKNMPVGIVGSLVVSTLVYVTVSLCVVGIAPFRYLGDTIPIVNALMVNACCSHTEQMKQMDFDQTEVCLRECQLPYEKPILAVVGQIVSGGAIFGLVGACFTSLMGQPRIVSWRPGRFSTSLCSSQLSRFRRVEVLPNGQRWIMVSNLC